MIINTIYAFIATFSFSILFNIRGKKLIFASIGGGVTWFFYLAVLYAHNSVSLAMFAASVIAGIYSEAMARILKTPVTTFAISSIIPLVPGSGMYYTMFESVQGNANKSLNLGLSTISSAGAIAIGILLASSITKVILYIINKTSRVL